MSRPFLSDEEIGDCYFNPPTTIANEFIDYDKVNRHIADTATREAIKWVAKWLRDNYDFDTSEIEAMINETGETTTEKDTTIE